VNKIDTVPFSKEDIDSIDTLIAKPLLVIELLNISEFRMLWQQARSIPEVVIMTVKPRLEVIFAGLSPEGRGALLAGENAVSFYSEAAVDEAKKVMIRLQYLKDVEEVLVKAGVPLDYQPRLEALVRPLGVPALADIMTLLDVKEWGIDKLLVGPIEGPSRDLLESMLIRGMTELSPAEAMSETPAAIRKRITRKIGPLSRHLKRFALQGRIRLWVLNVVYGESIRFPNCLSSPHLTH